jgi:peptide subunit release factor 1 (eRF1)
MWISAADEHKINRLRSLRAGKSVLSLYLPVEKGQALHHGHIAAAMDILRDLRERTSEDLAPALEEESARVMTFLREEYVPHGQTLVIFSSGPRRLWADVSVQLALKGIARFSAKPYLAPIDAAIEDYPRTAIALVDNKNARILTAFAGELEAEHRFSDELPRRQRQGGWSAFKYERDRVRHVAEHLVHVAEDLVSMQKSRPFKWLVLGGQKEATEALAGVLPRSLKARYCGSFKAEMFQPDDEVLKAGLPVAEAAERREEQELAQRANDMALKGLGASLGWDETLQCLNEGRVHELLIGAAACGTSRADAAFERAWDSDAKIEVLHGEAEEILAPNGGIAAILRY